MSEAPKKIGKPAARPGSEPRIYTRREVIARIGASAVAAAGTVALGGWLVDRKVQAAGPLVKIRDHRIVRPQGALQLAIARGKDPAVNVRRALAAMGGMEAFVKKGERVCVKPNVGWNRTPEQSANTDPAVVAEVVRACLAAGAAEVWVTDCPVNTADRCFARSGISAAAKEAGARVVLPSENGYRGVEVAGATLRVAEVLWPFVDADKVVNLPVVKHHGLSRATLSMKNWYGILGGHRARLHQDLHRSVVDLATLMKPTLTVMDATRILLANGPSGGSLDDVKRLDTIAISADEVALDAFGASLLGLAADQVGSIALGQQAGLGQADWKSLKLEEIAT
jgi:uncharacterized protein (DUF362 family)